MLRKRPWVRLKTAISLDGRTALENGRSQWITGEPARIDGHAFRKRAGAILTGVGTVLEDDPRLDVRLVDTPRQPLRVIVDSRLETPPSARMLLPPGPVLLYAAGHDRAREDALKDLSTNFNLTTAAFALAGCGAPADAGADDAPDSTISRSTRSFSRSAAKKNCLRSLPPTEIVMWVVVEPSAPSWRRPCNCA